MSRTDELYNHIKNALPFGAYDITDVLINLADSNEGIENLILEYGARCFAERYDKEE